MAWEQHRTRIHAECRTIWERTHPPHLAGDTWDYLFTGGKEIRARLFCELWQYLAPDVPIIPELGFVVECIHVASLIVDDSPYMDNAATRRGQPTLHMRYPLPVVGHICYDVMHMARQIWKRCKPSKIPSAEWNEWMRECLQKLIVGQWCDMERKGTALDLASLKTGILFELVAGTVARGTGLDPVFWQRWGNHVGVLFQWTDDWKDREEDRLAGSRNAFLEQPESEMLAQYRAIWESVQSGVGPTWFERPFGKYLHGYFDWCTSSSSGHAVLPPLRTIPMLFSEFPEANATPANDLIKLMYQFSMHAREDDEPQSLWNIPWEQWNQEKQMDSWCVEAEHRTGYAWRPLLERLRAAYRDQSHAKTYQAIVEAYLSQAT